MPINNQTRVVGNRSNRNYALNNGEPVWIAKTQQPNDYYNQNPPSAYAVVINHKLKGFYVEAINTLFLSSSGLCKGLMERNGETNQYAGTACVWVKRNGMPQILNMIPTNPW
jgi:hypothetical protein